MISYEFDNSGCMKSINFMEGKEIQHEKDISYRWTTFVSKYNSGVFLLIEIMR